MRCSAICAVSSATRALKTRTLAEEQRTLGHCRAFPRYLRNIQLEMWWIDLACPLSWTLFTAAEALSIFCGVFFFLFLFCYVLFLTVSSADSEVDLGPNPPSMRSFSTVIMSCIFSLKCVSPWPVWLCVGRDLLRLGGTLPGHNRKSPDSSQEIVRQQMSQTLPIRVWAAANLRIQNEW